MYVYVACLNIEIRRYGGGSCQLHQHILLAKLVYVYVDCIIINVKGVRCHSIENSISRLSVLISSIHLNGTISSCPIKFRSCFFPSMIDRHHQLRLLGILVYVYVDCINIDVKGVRGDERYPYDCINFAI